MFRIKVDPKELKASGAVAASAGLRGLRLTKAVVENRLPVDFNVATDLDMHIAWKTRPHVLHSPTQLLAYVDIKLAAVLSQQSEDSEKGDKQEAGSAGPDAEVVNVELSYELRYDIPDGPIPPDVVEAKGIEAFSKWNALYNCWPYMRQELSHLAQASGLPDFTLPLMMLVPEDRSSVPSEVDKPPPG